MKLLIVSNMGAKPSAPFQGVFVDKQVQKLQKKCIDLSYFNMYWNGDDILHKVFKYPFFYLSFIFKYILSFKRIDVIHVHYYYPTVLCALLYKFFRNYKVKVIVTCHGSDVYAYSSPSFIYRQSSKFVDYWLFTSALLQKSFFKNVKESSILSAGYDDDAYFLDNEHRCKEIDFLLVASLDFNKGLDRFFHLVKAFPQHNFALVGKGPLLSDVNNVVNECCNLQYLGGLTAEQLAIIYQKSKYLLSLSRNESFGLVITEAAACGVPCIGTETDGSIEQLPKNKFIIKQKNKTENDVLADLENITLYANSMSENEYINMSESAVENSKKYALSEVVRRLVQLYNSLGLNVKERSDVQ